jgi:hypothetical protein
MVAIMMWQQIKKIPASPPPAAAFVVPQKPDQSKTE